MDYRLVISVVCLSMCTFYCMLSYTYPVQFVYQSETAIIFLCKKPKTRNTETIKQPNTNKCRVETTTKGFKRTGVYRYRMVRRIMLVQSHTGQVCDREQR